MNRLEYKIHNTLDKMLILGAAVLATLTPANSYREIVYNSIWITGSLAFAVFDKYKTESDARKVSRLELGVD